MPRCNVGEQVKIYGAVLRAHRAQSVVQPSLTMKIGVEGIALPPLPVSKKLPLSWRRCGGCMEIPTSIMEFAKTCNCYCYVIALPFLYILPRSRTSLCFDHNIPK